MLRVEGDLELGFCDDGSRETEEETITTEDPTPRSLRCGSDNARNDRIRRSRNTGASPSTQPSAKTLTKADSFPFWGSLQRLRSGLKETLSFGSRHAEPPQELLFNSKRSSIPGAFKSMKRRSTVGRLITGMLPASFSPILGQEDDEYDLWFTDAEDFNPPICVLEKTTICTTYFVKATVCKKNFVLHQYDKGDLSEDDEKCVRRLVDFMQWLRHAHLVKCLGAWETDTVYCIVEEYCHRAHLLSQVVTNRRLFTEAFVVDNILTPLLDVLIYLHDMNIAHRGIRPENIVFGKGNILRLTGFISAIEFTRSRPCTRLGPLDYTAPEVLTLEEQEGSTSATMEEDELAEYDEKVDIWQLGVLTYELLSGTCPFEVSDPMRTSHLILWSEMHTFPASFSSGAVDFIQQTLRKEPHLRPSALELASHPWMQRKEGAQTSPARGFRTRSLKEKMRKWTRLPSLFGHWTRRIAPRGDPMPSPSPDPASESDASDSEEEGATGVPMLNRVHSGLEVPSILNIDFETADVFQLEQQLEL